MGSEGWRAGVGVFLRGLTKRNLLLSDPSSPLTTRSPSHHCFVHSKQVFLPNGSSHIVTTQRANTQGELGD